jgi:protein phosphatase 1 regulatory subunit 7
MTSAPTRITNPNSSGVALAGERLAAGEKLILQFDDARYTRADFQAINSLCALHGPSLEVRFYGHYGSAFDASLLSAIPAVANLSIDCLQQVLNIDSLSELGHLRTLALGVFELSDPHVLRFPNLCKIHSLSLGDSRSKNLDLSYLADYRELQSLHISGHTKGIADIAKLHALTSLRLWCISKRTSLEFVSSVRSLQRLCIGLGGRTSIAEIDSPSLQELEVIRVRGLAELSKIGRFSSLTSLSIEDQIQLHQLGFTLESAQLQSLKISNCKSLSELSGLENLGKLQELRISTTAIDPDVFANAPMPPSLQVCAFYTGKERENRRVRDALNARGFAEFKKEG